MTARLSRREFVQLGAGALALSSTSGSAQTPSSTYIFLHQTGHPGVSGFHLGALITESPQQHRDVIASLREATSYRRALQYKSTDKHKIDFCCRWIDHFVAAGGIRFVGGRVKLENWPTSPRKKDIVYYAAHRKLLDLAGLNAGTSVQIRTLNHGFQARSLALFQRFETDLPWPTVADWAHPAREPLLQIADFFTGSLQDGSHARTKLRLIEYLRKSLKVDHLDEASLRNSAVFRVREILA